MLALGVTGIAAVSGKSSTGAGEGGEVVEVTGEGVVDWVHERAELLVPACTVPHSFSWA